MKLTTDADHPAIQTGDQNNSEALTAEQCVAVFIFKLLENGVTVDQISASVGSETSVRFPTNKLPLFEYARQLSQQVISPAEVDDSHVLVGLLKVVQAAMQRPGSDMVSDMNADIVGQLYQEVVTEQGREMLEEWSDEIDRALALRRV